MNKNLYAVGILGLLALTAVGCEKSSSASDSKSTYAPRLKQVAVDVSTVRPQLLQTEVEFTGNLLPRRVTRIVSEVDGVVQSVPQVGAAFDVEVAGKRYVEQLGITYGQQVQKGDVLVQLDTQDDQVALQLAEAKLQKAEADLVQLRSWERPEQVQRLTALRDEAQARYEHALSNHRRLESLSLKNAATQSGLETAAMEVSTAYAALQAANAVLRQAQAGPTAEEISVQQALIAQAQAEVEQQKREIEKAAIRAPYDGVITSFNVEVGDRVSPSGNPVAELMDLSYLISEIAVPESFVGRVHVNDEATVKAAGIEQPVPGLVIAVNDYVDPATRTFQVRVAIDNAERRFKAGQFSTVTLAIGANETERLVVPNSAIVFVEGEPHVFTVADERVSSTPIEVGIANNRFTEIRGGLTAGDTVVVHDPTLLHDGMQVALRATPDSQLTTR